MKFLIIDDNPADRELIIQELKKEFADAQFVEIIRRSDFDEALHRADFDAVVTDYKLNWTDGLWILRTIKERLPHTPVVMATDFGNEEIAAEGMKSGLDGYVLKKNLRRIPFAVKESRERIRLLEELRESQARYRTLVEQIPVITYIAAFDEASTTLYVSPQIEMLLGYSQAEYKADPDIWRKRLHPDDYDRVMAEVAHSHATGEPLVLEYRMLTKDGHVVWFRDVAAIVRNEADRPLYLQGVMLDITEHKMAEEEREQLADRMRLLLESTDEGILGIDMNYRGTFFNKAASKMTGYAPEEVMGKNMHELMHHSYSDGTQYPIEQCPVFRTYRRGQGVRVDTEVLWRKDGTSFPAEFSSYPIIEDGTVKGAVITFVDITERKRAEEELHKARDELEGRVKERTTELSKSNALLEQEIIEHKRVEEALRASEANYRAIFNAANDAIFIHDIETGTILDINQKVTELYGYTPKEARGLTVVDLSAGVPPYSKEDALRWIKKAAKGEPQLFEWMAKDKIGRPFWVEVNLKRAVIGDKDRMLAVVRDIGERKQLEEERMQLANRIQLLLESTDEGIFGLDLEGHTILFNRAAAKMTGYAPEEVLGKDLHELIHHSRNDGSPYPEEECPIYHSLLTGQGIRLDSEVYWRKDGTSFPVEYSSYPTVEEGAIKGAVVTFTDITRRKRVEKALRESAELYRSLVETSPDAITATDLNGTIIMVNEQAERLYGAERPEQLIGKNAFKLVAPKDRKLAIENAEKVLETGVIRNVEYTLLKRDGTPYPVELSASVIRDAEGRPAAFISVLRDITERKQAKELSDALNDINAVVTSTLDVDKILQRVVVEAAKAIGCESTAIFMRENDVWTASYLYGFPQEFTGRRFSGDEVKAVKLVAETGTLFVSNDAYNDARLNRKIMEQYTIRSTLVIPLIVKGEVLGTLSFYYRTTPKAFTEAQIDFANKLATSISLALGNARLYAAQRNIADTLQEAILTVPQRIPGIEFGHLYRSATEATKVGGDFYDLFELEHGRVGITLGDISGKGLKAATLTSVVRNTIRAYAMEGYSPSEIMAKTNNAVRVASGPACFITVLFAVLDTDTGKLTYCSAGHPPAIVQRASTVELLKEHSPIIGAFAGMSYAEEETNLQKGDTLVLYTDGVTEARCEGGFYGEDRLIDFMTQAKEVSVKEMPQAIYSDVMAYSGGSLSDDIAILAISLGGEARA